MVIVYIVSSLAIGILIGLNISTLVLNAKRNEEIRKSNKFYKDLLKNIKNGNVKFGTRERNIVYLKCDYIENGVMLMYNLDKKTIYVIKNEELYKSLIYIDDKLALEISNEIEIVFNKNINDVVNLFGNLYSKDKVDDMLKGLGIDSLDSIIDKPYQSKPTFDIDDILDKISNSGIDSLTYDERIFLDEHSNKKD